MSIKNLVGLDWLNKHIKDPNLVVVDCRFQLGNPKKGYDDYLQDHISGSIYFDLEKDLSAPVSEHGGRHPLPAIENLVQIFSRAGIDQTKIVVAYDDQGGAMASRLWWLLKYLGHEKVYVLEENYTNWKRKEYPVSAEIRKPILTHFEPNIQDQMLVSINYVKQSINNKDVLFIDSRSNDRYQGKNENIDPIAGHIPSAKNEDWQNRITKEGRWKSQEEQEKDLGIYRNLDKEIIVYCGSGVTACVNFLALDSIGANPKLYAGSWSDWISYKDNPVVNEIN
ncbi:sulfurtransferase [Bacillaceae bacterium S4-13-58]